MRPSVAVIAQLGQKAPFRGSESLPEDVIPGVPHDLQQRGGVPITKHLLRVEPVFTKVSSRLGGSARLIDAFELALDERTEAAFEQLHRLADTFCVGDRHSSSPS